jgi:hypothetical protein
MLTSPNFQARQELLCNELKDSSATAFPKTLCAVGSDATSVATYSYSGLALHECIAKAWAGVLSSTTEGKEANEGSEFDATVLLQGVEVCITMACCAGSSVLRDTYIYVYQVLFMYTK